MSEADPSQGGRDEIWLEKYRPQTLSAVAGQDAIVERLQHYVDSDDLPNMLFAGPAGIGKCVTGETPVLTDSGLRRIDALVGDTDGFRDITGTRVLTLTRSGEFEYTEPSHAFARGSEELVDVSTRDGVDTTVTPEHRFLVLGHDGFEWREATALEAGDRLVRPLSAPLPPTETDLDWVTEMDGDSTFVHVSGEFAERHGIPSEERPTGAGTAAVRAPDDADFGTPSAVCSLASLRSLDISRGALRTHVRGVQCGAPGTDSDSAVITPAWELTPELAALVGLVIGGGRLEGGRVKLSSTDDGLLDRFERLLGDLFGVDTERGVQQAVPYVAAHNRTVVQYLESCFDVFRSARGGDVIGSTLLCADTDSRRAFLRAVFDSAAQVTQSGTIELTRTSQDHVTLCSYLLAGFGVPSRRNRNRDTTTSGPETGPECHTLSISGSSHLERFRTEVGFSVDRKASRLADSAGQSNCTENDTSPAQEAVETLSQRLDVSKQEHISGMPNPETPGQLRPAVAGAAGGPTLQTGTHALGPTGIRGTSGEATGPRTDTPIEHSDGNRTDCGRRTQSALDSIDQNGGAGSLPQFGTLTGQHRARLSRVASSETLRALRTLHLLAESELYLDEVRSVERAGDGGRVYDLTVPETHNYVAGRVPTVMHNTTSAIAIARELYGDGWEEHFLELNASDERGIDVIRDRVKSFARTSFGGANYRIIFLDEADALTSEAQAALRRTMEQFSNNVRFILSCNYSSQIIDPIQSRCAVFRFSPLSDEAVEKQVRHIAGQEAIDVTDDGVEALVYVAGGDMRSAINGLQAAAVTDGPVDEEAVFEITSTARPEDIEEMVTRALDGDFTASRSQLDRLLTEEGIAGGDIIDQLHRSVWEFDLGDEAAVRLLDRIGEADYRITEGANERIQLEALLASVALNETNRD